MTWHVNFELQVGRRMSFEVCGHCNKLLSLKSLKEHKKLFYHDGAWIKETEDNSSTTSSHISIPSIDEVEDDCNSNGFDDDMSMHCDFNSEEESDAAVACETEYWNENDSDLDDDFSIPLSKLPAVINQIDENKLNKDDEAVVWWIIAFTCTFQALHSLSTRAVAWLLVFLHAMLTLFGHWSDRITRIAQAFPSTLHRRDQYLNKFLVVPPVLKYVVCPTCLSLFKYEHCLDKVVTGVQIKLCYQCLSKKKQIPLLKEIVTSTGNKKYYPYLVFPSVSLVSSLQSMLSRPGFYNQCELWRQTNKENGLSLDDVYDGQLWKNFLNFDGKPFLGESNSLGLMLNIDWFQPYKHRTYSLGVIYLAIMNLPRPIRFKRENIIIVGVIPGPSEPKLTVNSYLTPLVSDLLTLWEGLTINTFDGGLQLMRCALLCVGCDLPAGRKTCGFLSHSANLGCSRCYCEFGTGVFGKMNYSGFQRSNWVLRTNRKHRADIKTILACTTSTERHHKESMYGCRYSCLLQLPYFDPIRMLIIDPMHNLYLGTAKHIFSQIWVGQGIVDSTSVKQINEKIRALDIPSSVRFNRLPPCMQYPASLTAEQWMLWVNYYSIYCLHNILSSEQLECWRHFVLASRILCQRKLTSNEIKIADALLLRFCQRFQAQYGQDSVTPNIHLHAHLVDCVSDYGPMSSFWLFSFERCNGILGDEPTNNRSIEVQLFNRFLKDNAHLQMLSSIPDASSDITETFLQAVADPAYNFMSTQHLDSRSQSLQDLNVVVPCTKYTISCFSEPEIDMLSSVYHRTYDSINTIKYFSRSFQKMMFISTRGQKITSGQYVLAKSVFPFSSSGTPSLRPAKVEYFFKHSLVKEFDSVSNIFAAVEWPMCHPFKDKIGKPYEIWCASAYETCNENIFLPINNIVTVLLTANHVIDDHNVLVTVPLIL